MRVSARRVAIVAGLVAGMYLVVVFSFRRVPDWVLHAIGGPSGSRATAGWSCAIAHRSRTTWQSSSDAPSAVVRRSAATLAISSSRCRE